MWTIDLSKLSLAIERFSIDLMHNDVKQWFRSSKCIVVVVVTNKSNMASNFPETGNLNGNIDVCSDVAGPSSSDPESLYRATHG